MFDTIIVGGGPAGLSAALVLGRCRRKTLVFDAGHPRNERSKAMHGFLSRDGVSPAEFAQICREQLREYPCIEFRQAEVADARREGDDFVVTLRDGSTEKTRTLVLATGLVDELPTYPGFDQFYARSVHHCPYCDGWEHRDQPIGVLGKKTPAAELAIELLQWSKDVILCTDGPAEFPEKICADLDRLGIPVRDEGIAALEGEGDAVRGARFRDGSFLARDAFFFSPGQHQRSPLAERLGCDFCDDGGIQCEEDASTCVPGVFAVGNASRGLQLVIIAAARGTQAAFAINQTLLARDAGDGTLTAESC